jgi:hypothetical protein
MPAFIFKDYGTFTGPQSINNPYNYEEISLEVEPAVGGEPPQWSNDLAIDTSFSLTDLGMVLFHTEGDYVGFYSPGSSTQVINLAHSTGEIPLFNIMSKNTIHSGKIIVNDSIICNGAVLCNVTIAGPTITSMVADTQVAKTLPAKPFDIPHPSKPETHRLRYISLEGPEIAVYFRGKLENTNVIELPEYWKDLIHPESISVNLTPYETYQELYVEKIVWGQQIIVKNRESGPTNCYFTVYAERKDMEKLIVEYEGTSAKDYPGQDWLNLRGN